MPDYNQMAGVSELSGHFIAKAEEAKQVPLVSSLPVVGILGRQHQVDGVYHDLSSDLVYIFVGMKFYTFAATEFKVSSSDLLFVVSLTQSRQTGLISTTQRKLSTASTRHRLLNTN